MSLNEVRPLVTKPLNAPNEPIDDGEFDEQESVELEYETRPAMPIEGEPDDRGEPAWRVVFQLSEAQSSPIWLDVWRVTVLGRSDPMSSFRPDLDFATSGGMRHGVSRRHALLRPGQDVLYLIDQNSTNGTWINGQRLIPGQAFPLSDGDVIELGALRMQFRIHDSPQGKPAQESSSRSNPLRGWTRGLR